MCFISENASSLCEVNAFPAPMCCAGDTTRCDKCVETLQRGAQLPVTTQVSWIEPTGGAQTALPSVLSSLHGNKSPTPLAPNFYSDTGGGTNGSPLLEWLTSPRDMNFKHKIIIIMTDI